MKNKWFYVHTISGVPAVYDGEQIHYANDIRGDGGITSVCESVKQIKKEQRLSIAWRKKQRWEADNSYGYVRIKRDLLGT